MGRMHRRFHAIPNRLRALLDQARGMFAYHRGRLLEARERLLSSTSRDAGLYHAHLYLGFVCAHEGAIARAAEEFRIAARIRPAAYLRHQAEIERLMLRAALDEVPPPVPEEGPGLVARHDACKPIETARPSRRHPLGTMATRSGASDLDAAVVPGEPCIPTRVQRDDFSSEAERRRFERLPPLHPLEIRVADWNDIGRRLLMPDPRRRGHGSEA